VKKWIPIIRTSEIVTMECLRCGITIERKSNVQKYCPECKRKINLGRCLEYRIPLREKLNYNTRKKNADKLLIPVPCIQCGAMIIRDGPRQTLCILCKEVNNVKSKKEWIKNNPEKIKIKQNTVNQERREFRANNPIIISCGLCKKAIHKTGRNKYCSECRPKIRSHRERRRKISKTNGFGYHSRLDFYRLCESLEWRCSYCGVILDYNNVTEDHIIPLSRGGSDGIDNITPSCLICNLKKGTKTYEEYVVWREKKCALAI